MPLSLSGKKCNIAGMSLTGKYYCSSFIPPDIKEIKISILNNLIFPLISKQWQTLQENMYCLKTIKQKLDYYYDSYKIEDLLIYKEIINAFEYILNEHEQLEELEQKMYGTTKDVSTIIYKTTMIRLKPEYEIYNLLLGKPDRNLNQKYNESILKEIEQMLLMPNPSFNKIKTYILNKYK